MVAKKLFLAERQCPPQATGNITIQDHYRTPPQLDGAFGIEVEVENCPCDFGDDPRHSLWRVTEDNSLRNHGREFVSRVLNPKSFDKALAQLQVMFNERYPDTDANYRCGTHIHYNQGTRTLFDTFEFIMAAIAMERMFLSAFAPDRAQSVYCVPWQDGRGLGRSLRRGMSGYHQALDIMIGNTSKYTTVNIIPLTQYGTVEFRMFPSTTSTNALKQYVKAIQNLDELVKLIGLQGIVDKLQNEQQEELVDFILKDVDPFVVVSDKQVIVDSLQGSLDFLLDLHV